MLLGKLVQERIDKEDLTVRGVARELGLAHSTVKRVLEGHNVDLPSLKLISDWLGVSPAAVLQADGVGDDALAAKIAMVVRSEPELAGVLNSALDDLMHDKLSLDDVRDIVDYAAFKTHERKRRGESERTAGNA